MEKRWWLFIHTCSLSRRLCWFLERILKFEIWLGASWCLIFPRSRTLQPIMIFWEALILSMLSLAPKFFAEGPSCAFLLFFRFFLPLSPASSSFAGSIRKINGFSEEMLPSVTEWWDSLTFTCGALETLLVEKHSQTRHLGNVGKNPTVSLVSTNFEFRSQEILLSMASPESSRSMSRAWRYIGVSKDGSCLRCSGRPVFSKQRTVSLVHWNRNQRPLASPIHSSASLVDNVYKF